jgi:hypothetical protein
MEAMSSGPPARTSPRRERGRACSPCSAVNGRRTPRPAARVLRPRPLHHRRPGLRVRFEQPRRGRRPGPSAPPRAPHRAPRRDRSCPGSRGGPRRGSRGTRRTRSRDADQRRHSSSPTHEPLGSLHVDSRSSASGPRSCARSITRLGDGLTGTLSSIALLLPVAVHITPQQHVQGRIRARHRELDASGGASRRGAVFTPPREDRSTMFEVWDSPDNSTRIAIGSSRSSRGRRGCGHCHVHPLHSPHPTEAGSRPRPELQIARFFSGSSRRAAADAERT